MLPFLPECKQWVNHLRKLFRWCSSRRRGMFVGCRAQETMTLTLLKLCGDLIWSSERCSRGRWFPLLEPTHRWHPLRTNCVGVTNFKCRYCVGQVSATYTFTHFLHLVFRAAQDTFLVLFVYLNSLYTIIGYGLFKVSDGLMNSVSMHIQVHGPN